MPKSVRSFDRINIPAPCDADWDSMIGNDRVRFCEHCKLDVTNLSVLTRPEAMRLVERSEGRLCVRFVTRPNGRVLTKQLPRKVHQIARRASRIAAGAFSATLSLSTAVAQTQTGAGLEAQRDRAVAAAVAVPLAHEAGVTGTVTDPNGAVVMGANVILSKKGSGAAFVCVTLEDGSYNFSKLEPGRYTVTVNAATFAPHSPVELDLSAASIRTMDLTVEVPELLEEVEIVLEEKTQFVTQGAVAVSRPSDPLIKAAFNDDLSALAELIPTSVDINLSDPATDTTALAYAVGNNNLDMVQVLISAGAAPNSLNRAGQTALMHLRSDATVEFVQKLIALGFDVKAHDNAGQSVLMSFVRSGSLAVTTELIRAGARIDDRDHEGNTLLMCAAENYDAGIVKYLIAAGAPLDRKNDDGESALLIAAREGRAESLRIMIDAGGAVDWGQKDLNEALLLTVRNGDISTLKFLLKLGAKANTKDDDTTALMLAAEYGTPEMIKALIDEGADVDAVDDNGWTAIMHANEAENVRTLLNAGANMAIKNSDGNTALAMAIKYEQEAIVQLLRSRGAPE